MFRAFLRFLPVFFTACLASAEIDSGIPDGSSGGEASTVPGADNDLNDADECTASLQALFGDFEISCEDVGCSSDRCQPVTDRISLCREDDEIATSCTASDDWGQTFDECGCDGLQCGDGERCIYAESLAENGGPFFYNQCFPPPCTTNEACESGHVCVPIAASYLAAGACYQAECTHDSDCNAEPCGACVLYKRKTGEFQGGNFEYFTGCLYPDTVVTHIKVGSEPEDRELVTWEEP